MLFIMPNLTSILELHILVPEIVKIYIFNFYSKIVYFLNKSIINQPNIFGTLDNNHPIIVYSIMIKSSLRDSLYAF
jgi:hypothetical protein